jgi:hypothetical protein
VCCKYLNLWYTPLSDTLFLSLLEENFDWVDIRSGYGCIFFIAFYYVQYPLWVYAKVIQEVCDTLEGLGSPLNGCVIPWFNLFLALANWPSTLICVIVLPLQIGCLFTHVDYLGSKSNDKYL